MSDADNSVDEGHIQGGLMEESDTEVNSHAANEAQVAPPGEKKQPCNRGEDECDGERGGSGEGKEESNNNNTQQSYLQPNNHTNSDTNMMVVASDSKDHHEDDESDQEPHTDMSDLSDSEEPETSNGAGCAVPSDHGALDHINEKMEEKKEYVPKNQDRILEEKKSLDLSAVKVTRRLNVDASRFRADLSKRGSLAQRRPPTKQALKGTSTTTSDHIYVDNTGIDTKKHRKNGCRSRESSHSDGSDGEHAISVSNKNQSDSRYVDDSDIIKKKNAANATKKQPPTKVQLLPENVTSHLTKAINEDARALLSTKVTKHSGKPTNSGTEKVTTTPAESAVKRPIPPKDLPKVLDPKAGRVKSPVSDSSTSSTPTTPSWIEEMKRRRANRTPQEADPKHVAGEKAENKSDQPSWMQNVKDKKKRNSAAFIHNETRKPESPSKDTPPWAEGRIALRHVDRPSLRTAYNAKKDTARAINPAKPTSPQSKKKHDQKSPATVDHDNNNKENSNKEHILPPISKVRPTKTQNNTEGEVTRVAADSQSGMRSHKRANLTKTLEAPLRKDKPLLCDVDTESVVSTTEGNKQHEIMSAQKLKSRERRDADAECTDTNKDERSTDNANKNVNNELKTTSAGKTLLRKSSTPSAESEGRNTNLAADVLKTTNKTSLGNKLTKTQERSTVLRKPTVTSDVAETSSSLLSSDTTTSTPTATTAADATTITTTSSTSSSSGSTSSTTTANSSKPGAVTSSNVVLRRRLNPLGNTATPADSSASGVTPMRDKSKRHSYMPSTSFTVSHDSTLNEAEPVIPAWKKQLAKKNKNKRASLDLQSTADLLPTDSATDASDTSNSVPAWKEALQKRLASNPRDDITEDGQPIEVEKPKQPEWMQIARNRNSRITGQT